MQGLTDNAEIRKRDVYVIRVLPSGDIMFLHFAQEFGAFLKKYCILFHGILFNPSFQILFYRGEDRLCLGTIYACNLGSKGDQMCL